MARDGETSQPQMLTVLRSDYWTQARQPLTSLVFAAPLLVVYEAGVLILGAGAVRNGADVWLRRLLELLDLGQYFLLPTLTVSILLGWHYTTRQPWRVSRGVLSGMVVESVLLAICLRILLHVQGVLLSGLSSWLAAVAPQPPLASVPQGLATMIGFLGAGIYEELLFRLVLLSLVRGAVQRAGATPRASLLIAVLVTSLVFAAAHYVGPFGDPVQLGRFAFWFGFLFRLLAGVYFSVLFAWRGFGIAVGAHAGYDILVKLW